MLRGGGTGDESASSVAGLGDVSNPKAEDDNTALSSAVFGKATTQSRDVLDATDLEQEDHQHSDDRVELQHATSNPANDGDGSISRKKIDYAAFEPVNMQQGNGDGEPMLVRPDLSTHDGKYSNQAISKHLKYLFLRHKTLSG